MKLPVFVLPSTRTAGALGVFQSVIWIVLCSIAMANYKQCLFLDDVPTNDKFITTVMQHHFFLNQNCSMQFLELSDVVTANQVFTWTAVLLSFCAVWLIASIVLLIYAVEEKIKTLNMVIYTWCIVTLAVTVVDFTLGIYFGLSHTAITNEMIGEPSDDVSSEGASPEATRFLGTNFFLSVEIFRIYYLDMLRTSAFILMTVALRGFVMIIVNLALVVVLFMQAYEINQVILEDQQHSIHSRQPIDAFAGNKQGNDIWNTQSSEFDQSERHGGQVNRAYRLDPDERNTWRSNLDRNQDYRSSDRSNSWRQQRERERESSNIGSRPFSYLEEPRPIRHQPPSPVPPSPSVLSPPWRRPNWEPAPPVPAPDYSPPQNRKLKSALKTGYM